MLVTVEVATTGVLEDQPAQEVTVEVATTGVLLAQVPQVPVLLDVGLTGVEEEPQLPQLAVLEVGFTGLLLVVDDQVAQVLEDEVLLVATTGVAQLPQLLQDEPHEVTVTATVAVEVPADAPAARPATAYAYFIFAD